MAEYNISDEVIKIPIQVENERYVKISTISLLDKIGSIFDSWYSSQYDCNSVYKNAAEIIDKAIMPIVKMGIKMLNDQGIYSINENIFINNYIPDFADDFIDALDTMQDKIDEIEGQKYSEKEYRQVRKAGRGRVIGGGFGVGGALKGMATAGVMNATTGMVHSLGNAVGNMGSSIAASANKSAVYKSSREPLRKELIQSGYNVENGIRAALDKEANIKCKPVTAAESNQAEAITQNYQQNRIPEGEKKKQIIQALVLNPYDFRIYEVIWSDYGDKNGDLKKMAAYFGYSLEQKIKVMAEKYGHELFLQNCKIYLDAFNKIKAATHTEQQIKITLDKLQAYCAEHDIEESFIPDIKTCKELLKEIDIERRTVKGVVYETREKAAEIKNDYNKFYKALSGRNILCQDSFQYIASIDFITDEFKENLKNLFEKECTLRTPGYIFTNIASLLKTSLSEAIINTNCFHIPGTLGIFQQKENMVRSIIKMPIEEVPLMLIERSANAKSGVLFTNISLRIYSKGIFSNENQAYPIESIDKIECIGSDEYLINICGSEAQKINLKQKNLSSEEQINIGNALDSIIKIIKNILPEERALLHRILYGVTVCECGTHLLSGEKICPSCKRMLKDNGEYVKTQLCPNCNNYIPIGKKFCSKCGNPLINDIDEKSVSIENVCPGCGNTIKSEHKFCAICGTKLQ